jgi:hypothetical protein
MKYKAKDESYQAENLEKKDIRYLEKQERVLFICFYVLLNMAEDVSVEYKMRQHKIVQYLCAMLERISSNDNREFLGEVFLLVVTFLKKLSVFADNKSELLEHDLVHKLIPFLTPEVMENVDLLESTLRLLFNLTFDPKMRLQILTSGMLEQFVNVLKIPQVQQVAVRVMYNISMDRQQMTKHFATFCKATAQVTSLILTSGNKQVDPELLALAINLSLDDANVRVIAGGDNVSHLIKRVHSTFDPLLMKLIRNISKLHDEKMQRRLTRHMHELCKMALKVQSMPAEKGQSFLVECLGTIANVQVKDMMYADLLGHGFHDFLVKSLLPDMTDDDVVLEVIRVLVTFTLDPDAAQYIGNNRLVSKLLELLYEKNDDVEIVFHIVYLLYKLLLTEESREVIVENDKLVFCLLDLCIDQNEQIRHFANLAVDIIFETSEEWHEKVLERRFETCNYFWLEFVNNGGVPDTSYDEHDGFVQVSGGEGEDSYYDESYEHPGHSGEFSAQHGRYDSMYSGGPPNAYEEAATGQKMYDMSDLSDFDFEDSHDQTR